VAAFDLGVVVERAGGTEQRLDVLGAIEPDRSASLRLQPPPAALGRVCEDQAVLDGDLENLPEAGDRLVGRRDRERAALALALAAAFVGVRVDDRFALGGRGFDRARFCDLRLAVAVYLGDRDLREAVIFEEREQVVGELPFVVEPGARPPLPLADLKSARGELVEGRVLRDLRGRLGNGRAPDPAAHVGEDVLQLGVSVVACVALPGVAEGDVVPFTVSAYPRGERDPSLALAFGDLAGCWTCHQ
jgi:hypothetical protein